MNIKHMLSTVLLNLSSSLLFLQKKKERKKKPCIFNLLPYRKVTRNLLSVINTRVHVFLTQNY